jgi:hypothetical protein
MIGSKELNNILTGFKESFTQDFKGHRDKRVSDIISHHFSLNEFGQTGITFKQSQLEKDAMAGDPFSLVILGKISYDNSDLARAFIYFDAATEKGDMFLANAVASYLGSHKEAWKYHRLAIAKGDSSSVQFLSRDPVGYYHAMIEEMTWNKKKWAREKKLTYPSKGGAYGSYDKWEDYYQNIIASFKKYAMEQPSKFQALCIECSVEKIENALNDKELAAHYFKKFQEDLADEILTASASIQYSKMSREQVTEKISAKYHIDYSKDLQTVIGRREKEIEEIAGNILEELQGTVLSQVKILLSSMKMHLQLNDEDYLDEENLTEQEQKLLSDIFNKDSGEGREGLPKQTMEELFKNNPEAHSILLQLEAFMEVNKKLDIPSISSAHQTYMYDQMLPAEQEAKFPKTEKLRQIADIIEENNKNLLAKAQGTTPPPEWSKFVKIFLAACTVVGIGLMIHSSRIYGTHKFWSSKAEKEQSRKEMVVQKAAAKAQASLFKPLTRYANRAVDELPTLKKIRKPK